MEKTTNEKIIGWIENKARTRYVNDIAAVLLYGSYVNKTAGPKSDIDCCFIPKTDRGYEFCADFIISGTGYDIFPVSWERLEGIADLDECLMPFVGDSEILYCASDSDMQRFTALKERLKKNLADDRAVRAAAEKRIAMAGAIYNGISENCGLKEARLASGYIIMTLADAAAVYSHTYFHFGLKKQFEDLRGIPGLPEEISGEYLRVIEADTPEETITHCLAMFGEVCEYTGIAFDFSKKAKENVGQESRISPPDYAGLACLYEEISSTFNKIYSCCESGNYILAFLSAVCLQYELDEAHKGCGSKEYDILSAYDCKNLDSIRESARETENDFVRFIKEGGGIIHSYESFEEFEAAGL